MSLALQLIQEAALLGGMALVWSTARKQLELVRRLNELVELLKRPVVFGLMAVRPLEDEATAPAEPQPRRDN